MEKVITISGIECRMKTSAAIPKIYRMKFKRDIFVDMQKLLKDMNKNKQKDESEYSIESLEMFENIAYLIHKHGDPSQPDDIIDWLDQFETFDIYTVLPEIIDMWGTENLQMSIPKKK